MKAIHRYRLSDYILQTVLTILLGTLMMVAYFQLGATMDVLLIFISAGVAAFTVKFRVLERELAELKATAQKSPG